MIARRVWAITVALWAVGASGQSCDSVFDSNFDSGGLPVVLTGSSTLMTSDGATHTFYYHVPKTPRSKRGHPVLFWLHGDGGSGNGFGTPFYPFTDPDSVIVITPSGTNQTWTHAADDLAGMPQDSQFISLIIDQLINQGIAGEAVDPLRIYLGGESRGAYMPYFLLQRPSTKHRLAAVAVNAGNLYCQNGDADCDSGDSSATIHNATAPILHIHGTNDDQVTPPTATFHDPITYPQDSLVFYPMALWAIQQGCFVGNNDGGLDDGVLQETYTANGHEANRYDLTGHGAACGKFQLILVNDGGHVISGQSQRIWSFLKNYCSN